MGIFNFSRSERTEEPVATPTPTIVETPTIVDTPQRRNDDNQSDELFSVPVKAGKRIYYFDVKATRAEDYYITITESRKKQQRDGSFTIDKHKIHLYKEDFAKFADGFEQVLAYVKEHKPEFFETNDSDNQGENL